MRQLCFFLWFPLLLTAAPPPLLEFQAATAPEAAIECVGQSSWRADHGLQVLNLDGSNGSWGRLTGSETLQADAALTVAVAFNCRRLPLWSADPVSVRQDSATLIGRGWNWELRIETNGALSARLTTVTGGVAAYSPPGLVVPGAWQHAALTCDADAGHLRLYLDGQEVAATEFAPVRLVDNPGEALLLGSSHGNWNPFDGAIRQAAVYDAVLTPPELAELAKTQPDSARQQQSATLRELGQSLLELDTPVARHWAAQLTAYAAAEALDPDRAADWQALAEQLLRQSALVPELLAYVVTPTSARAIRPDTRLPDAELNDRIRLVAARGEYEPASFVLRGLVDFPAVTFTLSDLTGPAGRIPATALDLRLVQCWYQAGGAWSDVWGVNKNVRVLVPELLLYDSELVRIDPVQQRNLIRMDTADGPRYVDLSQPADLAVSRWDQNIANADFPVHDAASLQPVTLTTGNNQQFWLTAHIPADAPDGIYNGTIQIASEGRPVGDLTVQVRVLPFDLAPPAPRYNPELPFHSSIYYTNIANDGDGAITPHNRSWAQIEAELRNLAAHGVTAPLNYQLLRGDADLTDFQRILELRRACGLEIRPVFLSAPEANLGHAFDTSPTALADVERRVRRIIDLVETVYGHRDVYFYGVDEAKDEKIAAQAPLWQAIRNAGGKVFVAGYKRVSLQQSGDLLDLLVAGGPPDPVEAAGWHQNGHTVWMYGNPQGGVENPALYRRNYGFALDSSDYDGTATYCYYEAFGHPWNDFDFVGVRDHNMVYPVPDGVIDTIAWEGYREGIDDIRYITTLRRAIRRSREAGGEAAAVANAAADWLARLDHQERSPETLRLELIRWMMKLEQTR